MDVMHIVIPGAPYGKARHRITKTGIVYTPKETVNYEALVKQTFVAAYPDWVPTSAAVKVHIMAYLEIPKSASKMKQIGMMTGAIQPAKKPDFDNIAKAITDPLNKILYRDDSQIVTCFVEKWYGDRPRVEVYITVLA
jgi:Holliday junction resolvase RusA-like endonuclease